MITHLAHLPTVHVRGVRRGMPVPECGFDVGQDVVVAWEPRYVDCKVCLEIIFERVTRPLNIPVVPGPTPLPRRVPMRAATPAEIDHLDTPIEFVYERPRGTRARRKFIEFGAAIVAAVLLMAGASAVAALTDRYNDRPAGVRVTPSPMPTPGAGFTTMPARP